MSSIVLLSVNPITEDEVLAGTGKLYFTIQYKPNMKALYSINILPLYEHIVFYAYTVCFHEIASILCRE